MGLFRVTLQKIGPTVRQSFTPRLRIRATGNYGGPQEWLSIVEALPKVR